MPLASHVRIPGPRSRMPLVAFARAAWTAPTTLLGRALGRLASGRAGRHVRSEVAEGWIYALPAHRLFAGIGAIALGHAILHREGYVDGLEGRVVLAHELAHTRQHDVLGPLYLPLHGLLQLASVALVLATRAEVRFSPVHDLNPLEQTWIAISAGAIRPFARGELLHAPDREAFLAAFGV